MGRHAPHRCETGASGGPGDGRIGARRAARARPAHGRGNGRGNGREVERGGREVARRARDERSPHHTARKSGGTAERAGGAPCARSGMPACARVPGPASHPATPGTRLCSMPDSAASCPAVTGNAALLSPRRLCPMPDPALACARLGLTRGPAQSPTALPRAAVVPPARLWAGWGRLRFVAGRLSRRAADALQAAGSRTMRPAVRRPCPGRFAGQVACRFTDGVADPLPRITRRVDRPDYRTAGTAGAARRRDRADAAVRSAPEF